MTLQTSGGGAGGLSGLHPDLVLLFVLAIGMRRGETAGALWGIGLGFVEDTFSAGLPGANLLTKGLLGFAAGTLSEQLDCDNPNTQAIVAAIATLLAGRGPPRAARGVLGGQRRARARSSARSPPRRRSTARCCPPPRSCGAPSSAGAAAGSRTPGA